MNRKANKKSLILYADDDQDDIDLVTEAFDQYKANVDIVTFQHGIKLLNHLAQITDGETLPCLIILDINMPILNGKETLTRIRQQKRYDNVPVIMFSTSSLPEDNRFALANTATLISKPLSAKHMVRIADLFLSHCHEEDKKRIQDLTSN